MKVISIQMLFKIRRLNNNPKKVSIIRGERHGGLSPGFSTAKRSGRLGEASKEGAANEEDNQECACSGSQRKKVF